MEKTSVKGENCLIDFLKFSYILCDSQTNVPTPKNVQVLIPRPMNVLIYMVQNFSDVIKLKILR